MSELSARYASIYFSSAAIGLRGLSPAGLRAAGPKRALGFVLQPVENWSRYPEFATLLEWLPPLAPGDRVLDLGSPKMFGLLLAREHPAAFVLTDLWPRAIEEIAELARANASRSAGTVHLETADLTRLESYEDASFTHLYSMSVIEHIEDLERTRVGLREMGRVLKPGGRLVLSFPVSPEHRTEYHAGEVYGRRGEQVFFSHYFDGSQALDLLRAVEGCEVQLLRYSRWRTEQDWLRAWMKVPRQIRGLLGLVNLAIAASATEVVDLDPKRPAPVQHEGDWIALLRKVSRS